MSLFEQSPEMPGWATQLLVLPSLVRIELGLWVAPERQRWSVDFMSFDHRNEEQLSLYVGKERHGLRLPEVKHALTIGLMSEWARYVEPVGPFDD